MKKISHWTPQYMLDRLALHFYYSTHKEEPWLTPEANNIPATLLRPIDPMMEFGSGRSTLWFAKKEKSLQVLKTTENGTTRSALQY